MYTHQIGSATGELKYYTQMCAVFHIRQAKPEDVVWIFTERIIYFLKKIRAGCHIAIDH